MQVHKIENKTRCLTERWLYPNSWRWEDSWIPIKSGRILPSDKWNIPISLLFIWHWCWRKWSVKYMQLIRFNQPLIIRCIHVKTSTPEENSPISQTLDLGPFTFTRIKLKNSETCGSIITTSFTKRIIINNIFLINPEKPLATNNQLGLSMSQSLTLILSAPMCFYGSNLQTLLHIDLWWKHLLDQISYIISFHLWSLKTQIKVGQMCCLHSIFILMHVFCCYGVSVLTATYNKRSVKDLKTD